MYKIGDFSDAKDGLKFLSLLKKKWDEIHNETNVFRYKISNLQEKLLDGYLLQLNPDRITKRRLPEHIDSISQPFDSDKFNFTKVSASEIIFNITEDNWEACYNSVLVNVSPISRYHSLLCPSVNSYLPQIVTQDSLELTLKLMFLAEDRSFCIGFNSLCALASVNHLHYHLFIEENKLPVETAKCKHLCGSVYCLEEYPVPGFCFQVESAASIQKISADVFKLLQYLIKSSVAHNIFMTKGDSVTECDEEVIRILIWPRKSSAGVKQLTSFNVAVCELSGWFPIYNSEDYNSIQKLDLDNELKKWKIDNFEKLCEEIKLLY